MRRSSQIGFGASVGLAIFSASFVADFSSERSSLLIWPQASAGMPGAATMSIGAGSGAAYRSKRGCPPEYGKGDAQQPDATPRGRNGCADALGWDADPALSSKARRQAFLEHVQQKLARKPEAGDPILP